MAFPFPAVINTFVQQTTAVAARQALGIYLTQTSLQTITMSGAFTLGITLTGITTVTFPETGVLMSTSGAGTFTNKTYDTAGAGNSFLINGLAATANTGTGGTVVRSVAPTLTGNTTVATINKLTLTVPATSATLTIADGGTLATSGAFSITLTATAGTSVTLPPSGTLATLAGSETLSNKTLTAVILGTPASGTLTNCTGLPVATGISGLGASVATFLATPSGANLAAAVTGETGTGALVFGTSPTFTGTITAAIANFSGAVDIDNTLTVSGAANFSGAVKSSSATAGIGYATGAGGTDGGSGASPRTVNKVCGQFTTLALTTAAGAEESYVVNNSTVAATDVIVVGTTYSSAGTPLLSVKAIGAGVFTVVITNAHSADAFNATMTINFVVLKGSAS